ncbi:MAG: hypothetical protein R3F16_19330 [Myxococcota bacterium]
MESALAALLAAPASERNDDLAPLAIDLRNATLDDPIADRAASRALERRRGLDPRLATRLDEIVGDDPLRLARSRQRDDWHLLWARTFNSISEPLGSTAITGFVLAPYTLANSFIHYFAEFSNAEPLSQTGRQALSLRREFLERHPDSPLAPELARRVDRDAIKLEKTLAMRRVRAGEDALEAGEARLARHHARAALDLLEPHPDANARLRRRAIRLAKASDAQTATRDRLLTRSLEVRPPTTGSVDSETSPAAIALAARVIAAPLAPGTLENELAAYRRVAGDRGRARVELVRAIAQHEAGFEAEARDRLEVVAALGRADIATARHARTWLDDEWQNPYGAFVRLRREGLRTELGWRLAGEWMRRPRYPNLPAPVAYLIDTPTIAVTIVLAPLRALISPWTGTPDFQRGAAAAGYRYLVRHPGGREQREVVEWLYDYEYDGEHFDRALRLADLMPDFDAGQREKLVEETASAQLERIDDVERRDARRSILEGVAREFPDSDGARDAGLRARAEALDASPQRIRITRSFLLENPEVAGPSGIGLAPQLLDDDPANGELHPDGVVLRGGRVIDVLLVAEGADDDAPPDSRLRKVSAERLERIASALEEATRRSGLVDVDARQEADATRDVYLERASLGLTDDVDPRASAESSFVYRSLRERYGMVRGRDPLLPFDLVFRGSLGDFSLGAFPRWRPPRQTPDAFLYR